MCCCGKPTINGDLGYKWQPTDQPSVRPVAPPDTESGDELHYDEPGRCGGLDAHCHHYRVVRRRGRWLLLVHHGGGDEVLRLSTTPAFLNSLGIMDSNARYWTLHVIYHAHHDACDATRDAVEEEWRRAAAEKRIKTRKRRNSNAVRVWIEPAASAKAETA